MARPGRFLSELHEAEPLLSTVGWITAGLGLFSLVLIPFDSREILGLNPWIKPIKFCVSITLYVWTLAWYLRYLNGPVRLIGAVRKTVAISMIGEIACIWMQSARGTTSHYNVATPFDGGVFATMGTLILLNTFAVVAVLGMFFWDHAELPPAYLWGIRLGLFLFFLGSMEGMLMVLNQAHTIGAVDGGPGLPFVNWSTKAGDLRPAHFIGLHALQALPLAGYALSRRRLPVVAQGVLLAMATAAYAGASYALFRWAMAGRPLIAL